jgi:hypothetical protein
MEAQLLPDGRIELILSRREFQVLNRSFIEVNTATHGDDAYPARVGLSEAQTGALFDEFLLLRYDRLGETRPIDPRTGKFWWTATEPRETGTAWDELPRMEGELLPDDRVALIVARGKLLIFGKLVKGMLDALRWDDRDVRVLVRMSVGEVEAIVAEFEHLHQALEDEEPGQDRH